MSWLEFFSSVLKTIAWPSIIGVIAFIYRNKISTMIHRLISVKYKDLDIKFAEVSKAMIDGNFSEKEKKEYQQLQIIYDEPPFFRLYANGMLVQKIILSIKAYVSSSDVTFVVVFPNEVISIQPSGSIDIVVSNLTVSGCDLSYTSSTEDREVTLIVSGI